MHHEPTRPRIRGARLLQAALVATVFVLAVPPVEAQSGTAIHGSANFQELLLDGERTTDGRLQVLGLPVVSNLNGDPTASFDFEAKNIHVTTVTETCKGAGPTGCATSVDPPAQSDVDHPSSSGTSMRFGEGSYAAMLPHAGQPTASLGNAKYGLKALDQVYFTPETTPATPKNPAAGPEYAFTLDEPTLQCAVTSPDGVLTLRGDLRIVLFDVDVRIRGQDGATTTYQSGSFMKPVAPGSPAYDEETKHVNLTLTDGVFRVYPHARPVQLNLALANVLLTGHARFGAAEGEIRGAANPITLRSGSIDIDSQDLAIALTPGKAGAPRYAATFEGTASQLRIDGTPVALASNGGATGVNARPFGNPVLWLVALPLVLITAATAWIVNQRRVRLPTADLHKHAEAAFAAGEYERARDQTRRVLRQEPANLDSTLLHAMSLLKLEQTREAVRFLEAQRPVVKNDHGMLSLVRSLGLVEIGEETLALRELERALRINPLLRKEIEGTKLFDRATRDPVLRSLLKLDSPGPSYA